MVVYAGQGPQGTQTTFASGGQGSSVHTGPAFMGEGHQNNSLTSTWSKSTSIFPNLPKVSRQGITPGQAPKSEPWSPQAPTGHRPEGLTTSGFGTRALVTFKDADLELDDEPRHRARFKLWMQSFKTWMMMMTPTMTTTTMT